MNSVHLIGRIARDWELKSTKSGKYYADNAIAVNKDKDNVIFVPIRTWEGQAETIIKYTKKGDKIGITGKLDINKWEDNNITNYYTFVLVREFSFI